MNNRILIGIIILVVLVAVGLIVGSNRPSVPATQVTPSADIKETSTSTQSTSPSASLEEEEQITLNSNGFSPDKLTIKAGTTVTWINQSRTVATVNSDPHPSHTDFPILNLGSFSDGEELSLKFDKPGTYGYHNHFNAAQKGTIIVE